MEEYEEEEEEEMYENDDNNKYNEENNFKKNKSKYDDFKFSPKKTKLNEKQFDSISRNPNLNNYSKNKNIKHKIKSIKNGQF